MMRNFNSVILIVFVVALVLAGCDAFSSSDDGGIVTFSGTVVNSLTGVGVEDVFVTASTDNDSLATTDADGRYTLSVEIDSTQELSLGFSKSGFIATNTTLLAVPERVIDVATVRLAPEDENTVDPSDPTTSSGKASNILLFSQSASSIGVRESGSQEVAEIVFQLADSLGRPISLDNQVTVNFSFGVNPGGGEFIEPVSAETDASGRVRTNISSGLIAGPLQVVAVATVDGRTIRSKPVAMAIHGGLPDDEHFGVVTEILNVARAYSFWGIETNVTAFVGDQYFNPVRTGTAVSFTSSAGIIGGSATTGPDGRASVRIISGPPIPNHPEFGPGYVTITASTADRNEQEITAETLVLFSGTSNIVVPPGQGQLIIGASYEFFVYDENQNPLASGTTITVLAEGTNIESFSNAGSPLTDNLFGDHNFESTGTTYGRTRFVFGVNQGDQVDDMGNPVEPNVEAVTIRVNSPNGNIERVVVSNGTVFERSPTGDLVPVID